jgi:hypothetical protein
MVPDDEWKFMSSLISSDLFGSPSIETSSSGDSMSSSRTMKVLFDNQAGDVHTPSKAIAASPFSTSTGIPPSMESSADPDDFQLHTPRQPAQHLSVAGSLFNYESFDHPLANCSTRESDFNNQDCHFNLPLGAAPAPELSPRPEINCVSYTKRYVILLQPL